jgi:hypothetical protein
MVSMYNLTKSGVDQIDATTKIYSCQRKVYKWWKALFFYLIDICIFDSSKIYFHKTKTNANSMMLFNRTKLYELNF